MTEQILKPKEKDELISELKKDNSINLNLLNLLEKKDEVYSQFVAFISRCPICIEKVRFVNNLFIILKDPIARKELENLQDQFLRELHS